MCKWCDYYQRQSWDYCGICYSSVPFLTGEPAKAPGKESKMRGLKRWVKKYIWEILTVLVVGGILAAFITRDMNRLLDCRAAGGQLVRVYMDWLVDDWKGNTGRLTCVEIVRPIRVEPAPDIEQ